jgi:hypothetical protein
MAVRLPPPARRLRTTAVAANTGKVGRRFVQIPEPRSSQSAGRTLDFGREAIEIVVIRPTPISRTTTPI